MFRNILFNKRASLILALSLVSLAQVFAQYSVDFSYPNSNQCGNTLVKLDFTNSGGTNVTGLKWHFGDGKTVNQGMVDGALGESLSFTASSIYNPGTYTPKVDVYLDNSNTKSTTVSATINVEIFPQPVVNIKKVSTEGTCAPVSITFKPEVVSGTITEFLWVYGDGITETVTTAQEVKHTFSTPGAYKVSLQVTDENGCVETFVFGEEITVGQGFNLKLESGGSRKTCTFPKEYQFNAKHDAGNFEYAWDFGDGGTSNLKNPTHTYTNPGNYTVSVTVVNLDNGCESKVVKGNYIQITELAADFNTTGALTGCPPLLIGFENISNIIDKNQEVIWDFGDGTTLTGKATDDEILKPEHTYTTQGTYSVTLTVNNPKQKCTGTIVKSDLIHIPDTLKPDFTADKTRFCDNTDLTVKFSGDALGASSWEWDFGDGNTSNLQNPTHTYGGYGAYTVKLTVTNAEGCTYEEEKKNFVVAGPTVADFGAFATGGCYPEFNSVLFDSSASVVPITGWEWTITHKETGTVAGTSTDQHPQLTLTEAGSYDVKLKVTTAEGCEDELIKEQFLTIGFRPDHFDFSASDNLICNGSGVSFTNHSTMPPDPPNPYPTKWYWDYLSIGEIMGSGYNGSYTYDDSDPNPVSVTLISENNGCLDTLVKKNILKIELPKADFEYFREPCVLDSIYLVDASMGAESFIWDISVEGQTPYTDTVNRNPVLYVPPGNNWNATFTAINRSARNGAGCTHSFSMGGSQPDNGMPDFSGVAINNTGTGECYPATFELDASTVNVPGTTISSYFWELGNNGLANGVTTTATYDKPGFYSVRLVITTADGCKFEHKMPDAIKVYGPVVNFEVCNAGTCVDSEVLFRDLSHSIADITKWTWEVDGTEVHSSTTSGEYIHVFDSAKNLPNQDGHYVVTLTIEDAKGCVGQSSIKVRPTKPIPDYTIEKEAICGGEMFSFSQLNKNSEGLKPFSAEWDFSNGESYSGMQPEDVFFEGSSDGTKHWSTVFIYDMNGCVDSLKKEFTVFTDSIIPAFSAEDTLATCPPFTVEFKDESILFDKHDSVENNISNWIWDFGDGTVITNVQNPFHTYERPGNYDVMLIVEDALGCKDSLMKEDYIVIQGPDGTYKVSDTIGYQPFTVELEGFPIPSSATYDYTWVMGNGESAFGQKTSYTYNVPSEKGKPYRLGLMLTDATCSFLLPELTNITVLPCPQLSDTTMEICVFGDEITLDVWHESHVLELGEISYKWISRESGSVVSTESTYTLAQPKGITENQVAIFDISLTVTDGGKVVCSQTIVDSVIFKPSPVAGFSLSKAVCEPVGGKYKLEFQSTSYPQGTAETITDVYWDFDQDSLFDDGTGEIVNYSFDSSGMKQISIAVVQANGCTDTLTELIYIPKADFAVDDNCQNETVTFTNLSEINPSETVSYSWDFGDGTTSTAESPTHIYDKEGDYEIRLVVEGESCTVTSEARIITVHPKPTASISIAEACFGKETTFELISEIVTGSVDTVKWDFENDGVIDLVSTDSVAQFIYPSLGNKTVSALLITDKGCELVIQENFSVNPVPVPNFTFEDKCAEDEVIFKDLSTIDDSEIATTLSLIEIDFDGNGSYDSTYNYGDAMEYAYATPGTYQVKYRVTSDKGCSDTISQTIHISPVPIAKFSYTDVCIGEFMSFVDQSESADGTIIGYEWDFESDGNIDAYGKSEAHKYDVPGTYEVTLTVRNAAGCQDQITKTVEVFPLPIIEAGDDVIICEGDSWTLGASSTSTINLWNWENGASNLATYDVSPTLTTTYYVEGTDEKGCVSWDSVTVTVINQPNLAEDTVACAGEVLTFDATIEGDYFATYLWNTGETTPSINAMQTGDYEVRVNVSGFDDSGRTCDFTHTISALFNPLPDPIGVDSIIFCFEDLTGTGRPDTTFQYIGDFTSIEWSDEPNFATSLSQTNDLLVTDAVEYYVSVVNEFGCTRTDSIRIVELCPTRVMFPTAFTPNADGLNDGFRVKGDNFLNFELTIFNRWGEVLFHTTNQEEEWGGTFNGRDLPGGVYPYMVVFEEELNPGEKVTEYGSVTLIR